MEDGALAGFLPAQKKAVGAALALGPERAHIAPDGKAERCHHDQDNGHSERVDFVQDSLLRLLDDDGRTVLPLMAAHTATVVNQPDGVVRLCETLHVC